MDALSIAFVTACTALISAVVGPAVSYVVARRQIRASVISNNRERWTEALRDSVAEYVALLLSASVVKENIGQNPLKTVVADHGLLDIVQRIILVKNKIMLMTNPADSRYQELCNVVEATYQTLISDDPRVLAKIHSGTEAITRAGREVLNAEWARVKRGD
jgi:putative ribosome biogenesis GTPase RsgA